GELEAVFGHLAINLAWPENGLGKMRVVRRIGPYLRLQAEPGARAVAPTAQPRHLTRREIAIEELQAGLCRPDLHLHARAPALQPRRLAQRPALGGEAEIVV